MKPIAAKPIIMENGNQLSQTTRSRTNTDQTKVPALQSRFPNTIDKKRWPGSSPTESKVKLMTNSRKDVRYLWVQDRAQI